MTADLQTNAAGHGLPGPEHLRAIFGFLTGEEIEILYSYLVPRAVPAEAVLMAEGAAGDFMGFLVHGRLAVQKKTSFAGKYILLAILDPGAMVGEMAAIDQHRHTVTITAVEESQLLVLTRARLQELLAREPLLGVKILRRIIRVLGLRLESADDRLVKLL